MTSTDNQLFSVEEAFTRLGQTKEQGCLMVSKGAELIHIYVQDGFVVRAQSTSREQAEAVEQALQLRDSSYTWMRGIQPPHPNKNIYLSIAELTTKYGSAAKPRMIATSRLGGVKKVEDEAKFRYFLVPQDRPTEKLFLTKNSTVMGRDKTSDLFIDNSDVSWRHCLLDIQARGISILDLNSTNGTFVNGTLVRDAALNHGDRIELGPCMFTINREAIDRP
jgi:hypothetical protein